MAVARTFRVPLGLGPEGSLVARADAVAGVSYRCPGCDDPLVVKQGKPQKHFSHRSSGRCAPESALHRIAKLIIANVVTAWRAGATPAPIVVRRCAKCASEIEQPLPEGRVTSAALERGLPSGHVVDVLLLNDVDPVAVIEVRFTHAVDEPKAATLELPWIELRAEDVIASPRRWTPLTDRFRSIKCSPCKEAEQRELANERRREDEARRLEAALVAVGFEARKYPGYKPRGIAICERCGGDIPHYAFVDRAARSAPKPLPPHSRVQFSGGYDWVPSFGGRNRREYSTALVIVSCCPRCGPKRR